LLGEGAARKVLVRGLGARERAGEKCCWRVEKAGRWVLVRLASCGWEDWVDAEAEEGGRMSVEAEGGKSCVRVPALLLPLLLGGREGRALVEELRECRVRWRDELASVGVRAPLRRERVLLSDVSGGRPTPVRCEDGRIAEPLLVLVTGREIFVVRDKLAEAVVELGGFGSREGDMLPRSRGVSAGISAVDLPY
jgi:hypothetical protein